MKYSVYIKNSSRQYEDMFLERGFELVDDYKLADLVQFTGGADVTPSYYGDKKNPRTGNNTTRDKEEHHLYSNCLYYRIPMAGICRGGQFLNVMNGGKMWQHVDGHAIHGTHPLLDMETKKVICEVSSTHHQMMRPLGGQVLGVAKEATFLEDAFDKYGCELIEHDDTEVVYFLKSKSLCFQPHPEFNGVEECRDYYFKLINKYLLTQPPRGKKTRERKKKTNTTFVTTAATTNDHW